MAGTLYLVPTPLGNLGDISKRQAETLASVDFIAAEDTRVSIKLLNHLDIKKPMLSYHEHNKAGGGVRILERLLAGEDCALVTDAGTPAISDPGEDLVRLAAESGVTVVPIPGPCAAITALAASGMPTGRFTFEGFLSAAGKSRRERLGELKTERRTMIFYEAPHKLVGTLEDMLAAWGDRALCIAREMTKLNEEIVRTTLSGALAVYKETAPRGEFVLIIAGAEPETPKATMDQALARVEALRAEGMRLKEASRAAAAETGLSRNEIYNAALRETGDGIE